jgi:hypothetical protein
MQLPAGGDVEAAAAADKGLKTAEGGSSGGKHYSEEIVRRANEKLQQIQNQLAKNREQAASLEKGGEASSHDHANSASGLGQLDGDAAATGKSMSPPSVSSKPSLSRVEDTESSRRMGAAPSMIPKQSKRSSGSGKGLPKPPMAATRHQTAFEAIRNRGRHGSL